MIQAPNYRESQAIAEFLATMTEESFAVLFEILYPKMLCFFMVRGTSRSTAEELAQDVLSAVHRHAAALRDRQLFSGWLFHIARNQLLQYLRKHRRDVNTVSIDDLDAKYAPETKEEALPERSELVEWVECLEPQERQIMMLRYIEELGYREIATVLEIPLGTVKWKIFNAKSKLGKALKDRNGYAARDHRTGLA
jgi:RNA polymerase sigma-70 factor (ECF subfamily)